MKDILDDTFFLWFCANSIYNGQPIRPAPAGTLTATRAGPQAGPTFWTVANLICSAVVHSHAVQRYVQSLEVGSWPRPYRAAAAAFGPLRLSE